MRITKFGHACVRIEHPGGVLVLDPGGFTQAEAVDGADAVLVTHEHADHLDLDHLRRANAPVFTIQAVARAVRDQDAGLGERLTVVSPGETFTAAGLAVTTVGEQHAVIHPDLPLFDNSGYLLDVEGTAVFHPGDALTVPEQRVDLLCLPVSAPWLKMSEAIDFARAVGAPRHLGIHDRINTEAAHGIFRQHFGRLVGDDVAFDLPADGQDL